MKGHTARFQPAEALNRFRACGDRRARVLCLAMPAILLLILMRTSAWAAQEAAPRAADASIQIQQVAPGIYAALQPFAGRFNDSNSVILVQDDGVVVIDTQTTLTATRSVIEQIRKITDKPVKYVINTHWHGDHVQGNQVYREAFPGVQFIAQENTREDMEKRTAAELKDEVANLPGQIDRYKQILASGKAPNGQPLTDAQKNLVEMRIDVFSRQLPDLRQTHIVLPDITFGETLTLYSGAKEIRLTHYAGHTRGDVAIFIPADKILVTGDLLDDMPFTGDGSPAGLVQTLREFDKLDFETIIPGHGGIEHGRAHLHQVTALFESIVSQVQAAVRDGLSLEDTKKRVNIEAFREPLTKGEEHASNAFNGFTADAIERAYQEATPKIKN